MVNVILKNAHTHRINDIGGALRVPARRTLIKWASTTLLWVAVSVGACVVALAVAGFRPIHTAGDSMEPTISGGSLVIARLTSPDDIETGDIIAVPVSSGDVPILQRVSSVFRDGERVAVITKDDNYSQYDGLTTLNGPVRRTVLVLQVGPWAGVALAWCGLMSSSLLGLWVTRPKGHPNGKDLDQGTTRRRTWRPFGGHRLRIL